MPTISPETKKLIDLASNVLATNEAGNKPYQLSHARLGNSGYSFGWNQFDIANNPTGLNIFIDILKNARTSNGQSILDSNWINSKKDIWGVTQNPNALSQSDINLINLALSSDYGKTKIDETFSYYILNSIDRVYSRVSNITNSILKSTIDNSLKIQLYLIDYDNQYGIQNNGLLHTFLKGGEVSIDGKKFRLNGDFSSENNVLQQIKEFIQSNKYGRENPEDVQRRFNNIEEIVLTQYCFTAETPILMSDGTYKPIEQIKIGDEVMAFDGLGELQPRKVTQTFITHDREVVQLGNIKVTLGHHFLQADGSFKALGEIDTDGFLAGVTGKLIPHPGIKPVAGKHTVYNFTVEDLHTYIAGDYRVHNESLSLYQPVTTGGFIGASIGSQIGSYFANDKFASQLVAQSLGKTVGSWVGDAIVYEFHLSDDPAFLNRSQQSLSLGAI
ncbi:Hint domain-containing protein [Microcystis aeruginosa]|jgi:hypothetical protein|uniref:Hint domain-containing protein n=1 Tax=Microcystis aeruginosa TaxID=1126 RepID=UPI00232E8F7E|nr:Hint domain-containing protein [Microcystis aeruginosa]MDB9433083.1 Hint domain-containing protein [Microcystis aeruginosa CS-552/01]